MTDFPEKVKLRTNYEDCPWITPGKVYEAKRISEFGLYEFTADFGTVRTGLTTSQHIGNQDWEILE